MSRERALYARKLRAASSASLPWPALRRQQLRIERVLTQPSQWAPIGTKLLNAGMYMIDMPSSSSFSSTTIDSLC
jgi:endonuclease III-like uncharacterized protein